MFLQPILIAFCLAGSNGALHFASYYQSHMVLQRGPSQAVIWGHATKIGDTVNVTLSGHGSVTGHVKADAKGHGMWKVKLPAVTAVHPLSVTATSSEGVVSISDVLFGDVWLCSGQSNMEFTVYQALNHTSELSTVHLYPDIRFMRVRNTKGSSVPLTEFSSNGIQTSWTKPNTGAVRGFSAVCWYFGKHLHEDRKYPIGLIESNVGGTPIEAWSSPDALRACSKRTKRTPSGHSVLWNTMINPLLGLTIYGAIWYQGESNAGSQASRYACQFPAMIEDWRDKFHRASLGQTSSKFPFGFVQLDAFRTVNRIGGFPIIRLGQTANHGTVPNADMKNTFMSVAMDLPDFKSPYGSIHPRDKQDVAQRLVLGARAVAYGETGVKFQGPYPRSISNNDGRHMVAVTYSYGPVDVRQKHGFEVCCSVHQTCHGDHTWVAAPIVSQKGDIIYLNSTKCDNKNSVGVRYAYRESPCTFKFCAIYGSNTLLPGPPFLHLSGFGSGTVTMG